MQVRRFKQPISFKDRLAAFSRDVLEKASRMPPGPERDNLLQKGSWANIAAHLDDRVNSPGLQPPSNSRRL